MKRRGIFIIHPVLFAMFPILSLFSYNKEEVLLSEIFLPALVVLVLTTALLFLLRQVFGERVKAGIMVSLFMFIFFSYGHFRSIVVILYEELGFYSIRSGMIQPGLIVLLFFTLLLIVSFYLLKRTRKQLRGLNVLLNLIGISLICITSTDIVAYELRTKRLFRTGVKNHEMPGDDKLCMSDGELPDIYYLICDRYTSSSVLLEYFSFDNSNFSDCLEKRGFYIAEQSRANYLSTWRSLASSLNMVHINGMVDSLGENYTDMTILYDMVKYNDVARFLKSRGYQYVLVGSVGGATRRGGVVDLSFNYSFGLPLSDFHLQIIELSVIHPIIVKVFVGDARNFTRNRILYQFQKLGEIPSITGPKLVFAHILVPHEPYVFDSNGELPSEWEVNQRSSKENYLNQLIFTNKKIAQLVDQILTRSENNPIIVIQADEGAHAVGFTNDVNLVTHSHIFNAYYLPKGDKNVFYSSISPVNTFRVIFNLYFGTNYELLDDKTYHSEDHRYPFKFVDVTDTVR